MDDFWNQLNNWFGPEGSGPEPAMDHNMWAKALFDVHSALLRAGFTVEQAFEIIKLEIAHTHRTLEMREARANPGR